MRLRNFLQQVATTQWIKKTRLVAYLNFDMTEITNRPKATSSHQVKATLSQVN
jgi:hypothetical protein